VVYLTAQLNEILFLRRAQSVSIHIAERRRLRVVSMVPSLEYYHHTITMYPSKAHPPFPDALRIIESIHSPRKRMGCFLTLVETFPLSSQMWSGRYTQGKGGLASTSILYRSGSWSWSTLSLGARL
jgi:hypothetical protein